MRRPRDLIVIDTPRGPHLAYGRNIEYAWPGIYEEAWRTGNRRQFPLEQLGKPVEFGDDYDIRQLAFDWICFHSSIYTTLPPQLWNPLAPQHYDFFKIQFQSAMTALMTGQMAQLDDLMRSLIDVFDWVVRFLERDGGFSPPGSGLYAQLYFIIRDSLPILLQIPNGGELALQMIRSFHRVNGKDKADIWMLLLTLGPNDQVVLQHTARTRALMYEDILGMKIDQMFTNRGYPPQYQGMIDQY